MSASFNRPPVDFEAINRAAVAACPGLLRSWFPAGRVLGREFCVGNIRGDRGDSLRINLDTGIWADFGDDAGPDHRGRDLVSLVAARSHVSQVEAARELSNVLGLSGAPPAKVIPLARSVAKKPTTGWDPILPVPADAPPPPPAEHPKFGKVAHIAEIRDPSGALLHYICRFEPQGARKQILPLSYGTTTDAETGEIQIGWRWKGPHSPRPLYGLPGLAAAPDALVVLVEGEPKRDAGQRLLGDQAVVVSWPNGADGVGASDWPSLRGRRVAIWPDADEKGKAAAAKVVELLKGIAASVVIIPLPEGATDGWDLADAEREGWTSQQVLAQIACAIEAQEQEGAQQDTAADPHTQNAEQPVEEETQRATEAEIEAEIQRLAGVSRIAYETERKTVAKALGVNVTWLDKSVRREQVRRYDEAARAQTKEPPPSPGEERWPDGFSMTDEGLFAVIDENNPQALISGPFTVLGESRDLHGEGWGKWIEWRDADNNEHRHPVANRLLHLQTGELESTLANGGLRISPETRHKGLLRKALSGVRSGNRVTLVTGPGWKPLPNGTRPYVFPDGSVIGETSEKLVLHPKPDNGRLLTGTAGTPTEWQNKVAAKVEGNDFAVFCIAAAFAAPVLDVVKENSGGTHLTGGSKVGKTLAAQVGLSVYGSPHLGLRSWRATTGNLEAAGEECTDRLLVLDEIHLADEREVIKDVYLLANGVGKGRLRDDATARPNRQWRVFVISTGEHDIATVAAKAKQKVPAGADIRLPSVKAEKGDAWPNLHGHALLQGLAEELHEAMRSQHGTIGREFIKRLSHERVVGLTDLLEAIRAMRDVFADDFPKDTDAQVHHVARRFALVACAGELAIEWGLLPWPEGEAERAVRAVFQRWLDGRGGSGSIEVDQRIERIRHFLLTDGASRFVTLTKNTTNTWEERNPERPILHRAGWRRETDDRRFEYLIPTDVWRAECVKLDLDPTETAKTLLAQGYLKPGEGKNLAPKERLPGVGKIRVYFVKPDLLGEGKDDTEAAP